MPTDPNTPRVVPAAEDPIPNLINGLFQKNALLPATVSDAVQKVTWPEDPPDIELSTSLEQLTLPEESVVNLPFPPKPLQLYEENWTADPTIKLLPIPTLPDKSEYPLTLSPDIR